MGSRAARRYSSKSLSQAATRVRKPLSLASRASRSSDRPEISRTGLCPTSSQSARSISRNRSRVADRQVHRKLPASLDRPRRGAGSSATTSYAWENLGCLIDATFELSALCDPVAHWTYTTHRAHKSFVTGRERTGALLSAPAGSPSSSGRCASVR